MLPCYGCAYRQEIPGDAHSRCVFNWMQKDPEGLVVKFTERVTRRTQQWFRFPFNYDPVWGPDECGQRAETRDAEMVAPSNPVAELLRLLR